MNDMTKRVCMLVAAGLSAAILAVRPATATDDRSAVTETFGDWTVSCRRQPARSETSGGNATCQMTQELHQSGTGQRALLFALPAKFARDGSNAVIVTPFGIDLAAGITVEVDGVALTRAAFRTCLPVGCVVRPQLDAAMFDRLQNGQVATVVMTALEGSSPVRIDVSLAGFTAASKRLGELTQQFD